MRKNLEYWQGLCPNLSIGQSNITSPVNLSDLETRKATDDIRGQGYLKIPNVISEPLIERIKQGMDQLVAAEISPVYIYLYDEPWQLFESLRPLLGRILGEDYKTLPNFWAWHIADAGARGWPPHFDCSAETVFDIGGDQMFLSFSLWVPLSDVEEGNGCMYVVPRDQEQKLPNDHEFRRDILGEFATPLPVPAGSVLGWPQDLIHWGGEYSNTQLPPRRSLSFEFQNTAFDPLLMPLLDTAKPPVFNDRLSLLDQQFDKYQHITADKG